MKQLSLMLLLIASSSSFVIGLPSASSYGMKSSEQLAPTQVNKPNPPSGRHKPHSRSCDLSLSGKRRTVIELALIARKPGETRPSSGMFKHYKVVPDEGN